MTDQIKRTGHDTDPQSRSDTAGYIADLTDELAGMAKASDLSLLAYLLDMASLEARNHLEPDQ